MEKSCRILRKRNLKGEWLDKATDLKNARQFGIHLNLHWYNYTTAPTLEIFSYDELVETNPMIANYKGFTHITFEVDNVNEVLEKVIENGGSKLGEVIYHFYEKLIHKILNLFLYC